MNRFPLLLAVAFVAMGIMPVNPVQQTYDTLKAAEMFTVGGIGYAGTISAEEQAFRKLLQQPEPAVRCKKLLEEATPAGQMYALLGLRLLDAEAFRAAAPRYKHAKENISTARGCIVMHFPAADIAKQIAEGAYK